MWCAKNDSKVDFDFEIALQIQRCTFARVISTPNRSGTSILLLCEKETTHLRQKKELHKNRDTDKEEERIVQILNVR